MFSFLRSLGGEVGGFVSGEECRYRNFGFLKDVKVVWFFRVFFRVDILVIIFCGLLVFTVLGFFCLDGGYYLFG